MTEELSYPSFVCTDADKKAYDVARAGGWDNWARNHTDLRAIEAGYYFNAKKALKVRRFLETFLYFAPKKRFTLLPFQWIDIIGPLFGWCRPDGKRRFTTAYICVPKGHGKSTLAAAISIYMLVADGRHRAETYIAAVDRVQATGVFTEASVMIANSPVLSKRLKIIPSTKRILVLGTGGVPTGLMRPLSKANNNEGLSHTHCMVFEELHVFKDREAYGSLRYATSKPELNSDHETPLTFSITTAGGDLVSIGHDEHEYAQKLLDNKLPGGPALDYYAVIYAVPEDADVFDIEEVKKANPGWGLTVDPERTKSELAKAKASAAEEIMWRRRRCNQWVGGSTKPWIPLQLWNAGALPKWDVEELVGRECYAALDLSSTSDLTALVLLFPEEDGSFHVLPYFFVPEKTAEERERRNRLTPYQKWSATELHPEIIRKVVVEKAKRQGEEEDRIITHTLAAAPLMFSTPGDAVDYDFVRAKAGELAHVFSIRQIAIDRGWQGQAIMTGLQSDGFDVVPFGQGFFSMAMPVKLFEAAARGGKIRHGNNPILTWNLTNCRMNVDPAGNMKPDKKKSTDKIDGIVATIMAMGIAGLNEAVAGDAGIYSPAQEAKKRAEQENKGKPTG